MSGGEFGGVCCGSCSEVSMNHWEQRAGVPQPELAVICGLPDGLSGLAMMGDGQASWGALV